MPFLQKNNLTIWHVHWPPDQVKIKCNYCFAPVGSDPWFIPYDYNANKEFFKGKYYTCSVVCSYRLIVELYNENIARSQYLLSRLSPTPIEMGPIDPRENSVKCHYCSKIVGPRVLFCSTSCDDGYKLYKLNQNHMTCTKRPPHWSLFDCFGGDLSVSAYWSETDSESPILKARHQAVNEEKTQFTIEPRGEDIDSLFSACLKRYLDTPTSLPPKPKRPRKTTKNPND